ncbi:hypothetical protein CBS147346_1086 [Aspergillus niger]|nr:hypothetical protein CBS147346_1086 [Aspergillus niger]
MNYEQGKLVLITGATGHVGHAVLLRALSAGYQVRITLREPSKAALIRDSLPGRDHLHRLSFVTVCDFTQRGAFDEALQDVSYIIHIASPLQRPAYTDYNRDIIAPTVQGTSNLLHSALNHPTVQRIVITSSTSAILDINPTNNLPLTPSDHPISPTHRHPNYGPDFITTSEHAYIAAKTAALNLASAFRAQNSPHFDIIHLLPGYVFGPKGLATTPREAISGSNVFGIGLVMRKGSWRDWVVEAMSCHVDDIAEAHVNALDPRVAGNQDFILSVPFRPEEVKSIIRKRFPEEGDMVKEGIFAGGNEYYRWFHVSYDVSSSEEMLLGRKLRGIEEQIVDSAKQVLALVKN